MKKKIEELYIEGINNDVAPNVFAEQVLNLFIVSESEFENKLYAKCLEGMPDMTIDEFNDTLTDWVQKEVKHKQIEEFNTHSR